jgi:hypothetical protein
MKFYLYALIALFAMALVLGCTGGGTQNQTTTGPVTVTPTQLVGGGTATVQYTLTNNYENDMNNVKISMLSVPSSYTGYSSLTPSKIVSNQQYPAIFTITAPSVSIKQTFTPKIQVCYDYTTNYFFDAALKTSKLATEAVNVESGSSTGPISVSAMGFDSVFLTTADEDHMGSLSITNIGTGKIMAINSIAIIEDSTNINSAKISYSDCGPATEIKPPSAATCSATSPPACCILRNTLAITNGLTASLTINTAPDTLTSVSTERLSGSVLVNYCYEVPVGTITVCPAGKAC